MSCSSSCRVPTMQQVLCQLRSPFLCVALWFSVGFSAWLTVFCLDGLQLVFAPGNFSYFALPVFFSLIDLAYCSFCASFGVFVFEVVAFIYSWAFLLFPLFPYCRFLLDLRGDLFCLFPFIFLIIFVAFRYFLSCFNVICCWCLCPSLLQLFEFFLNLCSWWLLCWVWFFLDGALFVGYLFFVGCVVSIWIAGIVFGLRQLRRQGLSYQLGLAFFWGLLFFGFRVFTFCIFGGGFLFSFSILCFGRGGDLGGFVCRQLVVLLIFGGFLVMSFHFCAPVFPVGDVYIDCCRYGV